MYYIDTNQMMHSKIINDLEKNMVAVKKAMEKRGLNVDLSKLKDLIEETSQKGKDLELKLNHSLGLRGEVNYNSSNDVADILSVKLGVKPQRTKSGRFTTCRRVLKDINNPITDEISQYRDLEKCLSYLKAIYQATDKRKGRIFCVYIDACPSGRLYTKNYSFQTIPQTARHVIYPDRGCSFILADFNSFELRILSAVSHDKYFKDCWAQGLDLHKKVVSDMKLITYDSVSDKERKLGKALNFGLAYGQESHGLARKLHIPTYQAQGLMNNYKSKIPEIEKFKLEVIKKARRSGFVETYYGRKRFLPNITSPNKSDRKKAERRVINTMIQGTGADIVKFALVNLHKAGFKIDTMLHDGILLTVPNGSVEHSLKQIKKIMETELEGMKFIVTCKTAKTWGDCY